MRRNGRPATYYKLIVDGRTIEVFRASRKTDRHRNFQKLHGCHIQPALQSEYQSFVEANNLKPKSKEMKK